LMDPSSRSPPKHRRAAVDELLVAARSRLRRLTSTEARDAAQAGGLIVDIRSEHQRQAQGLVPGARFVPATSPSGAWTPGARTAIRSSSRSAGRSS
jgi:hypothetical protein